MKHKSIFFFYFLNTVWPCAFNVWYPHFDKQHEVFLSHVFLSVPLFPPFPLSLPFTTLTLSSISKLKRHQICLWRKVLSNHFREVFFFSFRGRTCEISQPQTSVGWPQQRANSSSNTQHLMHISQRCIPNVSTCVWLCIYVCAYSCDSGCWCVYACVGRVGMHMCACLLVQWLQHELQNYSSCFSEDTTGSPK